MATATYTIAAGATTRWGWSVRNDSGTTIGGATLNCHSGAATSNARMSALSFPVDVAIPPGSRIDSVYLDVDPSSTAADDANLDVKYEDVADGGIFDTGSRKPVSITLAAAAVAWVETAVAAAGGYGTLDITSLFSAWFTSWGAPGTTRFNLFLVGRTGVAGQSFDINTPAESNPPRLRATWTPPELITPNPISNRLLVTGVLP